MEAPLSFDNVPIVPCLQQWPLGLQTKIREDFTITVKVPIPTGAFATMLYIKVLVGVFNKDSVL